MPPEFRSEATDLGDLDDELDRVRVEIIALSLLFQSLAAALAVRTEDPQKFLNAVLDGAKYGADNSEFREPRTAEQWKLQTKKSIDRVLGRLAAIDPELRVP